MSTVTREFMDGTSVEVPVALPAHARPTLGQIIKAYAGLTKLSIDDLTGKGKTAAVTEKRHELMYLLKRHLAPAASYTMIGRFLGGRDMATVHEAVSKIEARVEQDPTFGDILANRAAQLGANALMQAAAEAPPKPWQLLAAAQVLRDGQMTDAEARKVALSFIEQLEAAHG